MAPRQKPSFDDRVLEYVNSPLMTQRVRIGNCVSARIQGNFGAYRTQVTQTKELEGECSCPSEIWPCKHVHALRRTWQTNPASFFDLDDWLKKLANEPKATLVEAIGNIIIASPEMLSVFGVPGFDFLDDVDDPYGKYYE
jgi:hypothetical protein